MTPTGAVRRAGWSGGRRKVAVLGVSLLVLTASMAAGAGSAVAADTTTTHCSRTHPLTGPVSGNLIVSAGQRCDLMYDVAGNAVVEAGAGLSGGARVAGHVHVGRGGGVYLDHGEGVGGYVVLDHAASVRLYNVAVGGSMVGSLETGGSVFFQYAGVLGRLAISGTGPGATVSSYGLDVGGDTVLDGVRVAVQEGDTLGGRLVLRHVFDGDPITSPYGATFTGSVVCGGTVAGNVTVENSTGTVDIGAGAACRAQESRLSVRGSLLAHDNPASIFVGGQVGGDAVCRDNVHHPRGDGSTTGATALQVDGRRLGQCARLPRP